jgi:hypothetical protein
MAHHDPEASITRYLLTQCCFGGAFGALVGLLVSATNVAGIGTLVVGSPLTIVIVMAGAVCTFLPLVVATAVGLLGYHEPRRVRALGSE